MDPAPWPEIDEVLGAALALPPGEREAFLDRRCEGRPALRTEVEALLANCGGAEGFLEPPGATRLLEETGPAPQGLAGTRIGPYRLAAEIARGGMGVVYRAVRDDGEYSMQVAVKLLFPGGPRIHSPRRLRAEQQILARLEHPNIARLLDAGVTADGLPYIVMEYVDGQPITAWCDERRLGVRERIELFSTVCRAVHFAHQNLVVHRDLKPGNILVNSQGMPKLLDFGIARLLTGETTGSEHTSTILQAMTIDYASPEQVRCEPPTIACDIYSLGVVLYELLAGRRPWSLAGKTLTEILRIVEQQDPDKPSLAARAAGGGRALAGELDSIVLKAMRKSPAGRYGSAQELADDLGRFLAGMPVQARHGSFGYLAGKLLARYRMQVAASAAALALLAGSGAAVYWQARRAEQERTLRRNEVGRLVQSLMFDTNEEMARLAGSTPVRKRLVERSLAYLDALARENGGRDFQYELAGGYSRLAEVQGHPNWPNLGDRAGALASYRKARAILEAMLSRDPEDRRARFQLAALLLELRQLEDRPEAAATVSQTEALVERLLRDAPHNEAFLELLASTRYAQSEFVSETERLRRLEQALAIYSRLLESAPGQPKRQRNVALMHKYIAGCLNEKDPEQMLRHIRSAQALDEKRVAADPNDRLAKLDLSFDLSMLAEYFRNRGEPLKVAATFETVAALRRELWRTDPQDARARNRLAYALYRLGQAQIQTGKLGPAQARLQEALRHAEALGPGGPETGLPEILAFSFSGLGDIHARLAAQAAGSSAERRNLRRQACREYRLGLQHLKQVAPSRYKARSLEELEPKVRACESEGWK